LRQAYHLAFACEPIHDAFAVASCCDQRGPPKNLQVTGGVGERQTCPRRQSLHASLALAQVLQEFQTVRMAQRLRDLGKALKNRLLWPRTRQRSLPA
jgi:hypothetical protein